jgi:L-ascorbate metabolism protein UlaG (beta-lactamase superfamily)
MMSLRWLGHATVDLEIGGRRLLTDPVLRPGIGPIRRRTDLVDHDLDTIDAVLISHLHHDHLDLASLRLLRREVRVVVPAGAGGLVRANGARAVTELDVGDVTTVGDVAVRAVHARHSGRRVPFGPSAPALGFVIEGDDTVYFAGDTDIFPGMAELSTRLDLAILPVGGWGPSLRGGHLDPVRAAEALTLLRPRAAVAIHWGTLWPIGMSRVRRELFEGPARRFIEEAARVAPTVTIPLLDPGDRYDLPAGG